MRRYLAGLLVAVLIVVAVAVSQGALTSTSAPSTSPTAVAILSAPSASPTPVATTQASTSFPPTTPAPRLDPSAVQVHRGLLRPGSYHYLNVDGQGFNVQLTVPAGWTWNGRYLGKGGVDPPGGAAIFFFGGPVQVYADPCHWAGPQPSHGAVANAGERASLLVLAAQPSRSATTPLDHPYGFWPGMAVQLTVPDDIDLAACDGGQFRSWGPENNVRIHQGPGQRDLVWAVDIGGTGLIVDAASFPGTSPDVRAEIDAIVGSLIIGHWG